MSSENSRLKFLDFEFDPDRLALYHSGEIMATERRALEVLRILLGSAGTLVSTQEIIDQVWTDNQHGVTGTHLAQYISKLRRTFASYDNENVYIETSRGRGYIFKQPVEVVEAATESRLADGPFSAPATSYSDDPRSAFLRSSAVAMSLLAVFLVVALTAWNYYPTDDQKEIRRVLEESQKYESLVIYRDPGNVDETKITEYWISQDDHVMDVDIRNIRTGIARLLRDESHYGPETRNLIFEIQDIEIGRDRDFATARTLEKWFIAEYKNDGTLVRNKTVGPYFVHYMLRKVDGSWKIERSSTARATLPPPAIDAVEEKSEALGGNEFFIRITGKGFALNSVFVRAVGPGCPESSPCIVPNSLLRLKSQISDEVIDGVPLTLSSGEFLISAQNGDSPSSNIKTIAVK